MALGVVGMWIRSSVVYDQCVWSDSTQKHMVYSLNGDFGWWCWDDNGHHKLSYGGGVPLGPDGEAKWRMLLSMTEAFRHPRQWTGSYSPIAITLSVLAACLILWRGKRPERKAKAPVEDK